MSDRPTLAVPTMMPEGYIAYFGNLQYVEFCTVLGLPQLPYSEFVNRTVEQGPYWWEKSLVLGDIQILPPVEQYRLLLAHAHPKEFHGPERYFNYIKLYKGDRRKLLLELGGNPGTEWFERALCI